MRGGGIGIVHINRVGFIENVGAFFTEGQSKLPVIINDSSILRPGVGASRYKLE